jgi:lon-related putative ATP-dependent protease
VRKLKAEDLRAVCDPALLPFASTEDLPPLEGMIGQDRALSATTFGISMRHHGYNLFVLGPPATGKSRTMRRILDATAQREPVPTDYCYVFNFAEPYRPVALELPAGRARELQEEMRRLVEDCRVRLPRVFESEEFERQRARVVEAAERQQGEEIAQLEAAARAAGFAVIRLPHGVAVAPAPRGEPLSAEEFAALPDAARAEMEARGHAVGERLEATLRRLRQVDREVRAAYDRLVGDAAAAAIKPLVADVRERFAGIMAVGKYLDQVEQDLVAHAAEFRQLQDGKPTFPFVSQPGAFLDRYRVNVLVDRSGTTGAPVVVERNPTHRNLLGRIDHHVHLGTLVTDLTLIKAGALHQANGGYLILDAKDVLRAPFAWEALKKALTSRSIRVETPMEELSLASTTSLAPEPIPLSVKIVLLGSPLLYYLLHALDEDFRELFKVKVDFDDSLPRTPEYELLLARFVGSACREESLLPFSVDGVARLIEHGCRLAGHRERVTAKLGELLDLIRESAFWARERQRQQVTAGDVSHAIAQKTYRSNLVEERIARTIGEGTLLIDTEGTVVGQVNGIALLTLGDYTFGRPTRITARSYSGKPGVVDVEREAQLGGRIHSKGVMILTGFLAGRYARQRPLALSASLAFEQQYEEVEGDSASSAELYALLSSLGGVPLAQHLAVTGSVNQRGEIQPVGGINEKIEGFFDVCKARGLTGRQGVLIPERNLRHLMLGEEVVDAVRQDRFHLYAVATVDEGLALLSGIEAGARGPDGRFPEGSFNAAVETTLAENVARLKEIS